MDPPGVLLHCRRYHVGSSLGLWHDSILMNETVIKIGQASRVQDILDQLNECSDTDELVVLRSYRDKETGQRRLEWWTTAIDSRIWTCGALTHLANKISMSDPE